MNLFHKNINAARSSNLTAHSRRGMSLDPFRTMPRFHVVGARPRAPTLLGWPWRTGTSAAQEYRWFSHFFIRIGGALAPLGGIEDAAQYPPPAQSYMGMVCLPLLPCGAMPGYLEDTNCDFKISIQGADEGVCRPRNIILMDLILFFNRNIFF
jgi:hypothetical protein